MIIWILLKTVARFSDLLKDLEIPYPEYGTAFTADEAIEVANKVGYPVLVRPSYVLGGQRMSIVINDDELEKAVVSLLKHIPNNKILIDHFLDRCQEAEIDAIFDGEDFHVMGVMEHIEPAGIHSGDSNAVLPAFNLTPLVITTMEYYAEKIARALNIRGLINIQFAIKDGNVFVIEANPTRKPHYAVYCKSISNSLFKYCHQSYVRRGKIERLYD